MMGHLAIYTYGKSTLEDASYNGLSLIYASELEAETLEVVSLLWTEKSAVFCRRQRVLNTASPEVLDTGTQIIKKQKEKPQNRDLVVTSTRESSIVVVLELFCGFLFAPPCCR